MTVNIITFSRKKFAENFYTYIIVIVYYCVQYTLYYRTEWPGNFFFLRYSYTGWSTNYIRHSLSLGTFIGFFVVVDDLRNKQLSNVKKTLCHYTMRSEISRDKGDTKNIEDARHFRSARFLNCQRNKKTSEKLLLFKLMSVWQLVNRPV